MSTVRIEIDGTLHAGIAYVRAPYDPQRVEIMRRQSPRHWNAELRCDVIAAGAVPFLRHQLEVELGDTVLVTYRHPEQKKRDEAHRCNTTPSLQKEDTQ